MSTPSAHDLFMIVWSARISSGDHQIPGDNHWDPAVMRKVWAKTWLDCCDVANTLQAFESLDESVRELVSPIDDLVEQLSETSVNDGDEK